LNNLCFPIPGDTTLLTAGFLADKGILSPWAVIAVGALACFLGSNIAYLLGSRYGRRLLEKNRWLGVTPVRFRKMERFFARFVGFLHPVTGLLAGIWKTPRRPFLFYNLAGALSYAATYTMAGYLFRQKWESFKHGVGPVVLYVILIGLGLLILGLFLRRALHDFFLETPPAHPSSRVKSRRS
jgi:membrane protein DedA with SNARE-associated domain